MSKSSNIKDSIYYNLSNELHLTFKGGTTYIYKKVPIDIFAEFANSESLGKAFHTLIKPNYEFEKVENED